MEDCNKKEVSGNYERDTLTRSEGSFYEAYSRKSPRLVIVCEHYYNNAKYW